MMDTAQKSKRARRKAPRLALALVAALATAGLGAEVGRAWVLGQIEDRARDAASERGWALSWSRMELGYDLTLRIDKLVATSAGDDRIEIDTVVTTSTLAPVLEGRRVPDTLTVSGLSADIHVEAL